MLNRALHNKSARRHYLLSTQARLDLKGIKNEEARNSTIDYRDLNENEALIKV
jgi:DNA-nicking Smr family endonuclease